MSRKDSLHAKRVIHLVGITLDHVVAHRAKAQADGMKAVVHEPLSRARIQTTEEANPTRRGIDAGAHGGQAIRARLSSNPARAKRTKVKSDRYRVC